MHYQNDKNTRNFIADKFRRFFAPSLSSVAFFCCVHAIAQQLPVYSDQPDFSFQNVIASTMAEDCALSAFERAYATDLNKDGWKDILLYYLCRPLEERGVLPEYPYLEEKLHNALVVLLSDEDKGYRIATEELFGRTHLEIGGDTGGAFLGPLFIDLNNDERTDVVFSSNRDLQQRFTEDTANAGAFQEVILSQADGSYRLVQTTDKAYFALYPQLGPADNGQQWYFTQYFKGQRTDLGNDPLPLVFEYNEASDTVKQKIQNLSDFQSNFMTELSSDFVGYAKYLTPDVNGAARKNLIADELVYVEALEINRGTTPELDRQAWNVSFQTLDTDGSLQVIRKKQINDIFEPINCPEYDRDRFLEPGNDWYLFQLELNMCWRDSNTGLTVITRPRFVAARLWEASANEIRPFIFMEGFRLRRQFDINSGTKLVPEDIVGLAALLEFDWHADDLNFKGFLADDPFWSGGPADILLLDANGDGFQDVVLGGASYGPHDFYLNDKQGSLISANDFSDWPTLQINDQTKAYPRFDGVYRFLFDLNNDGYLDVVQAPVGVLDYQGYPPSADDPDVLATVDGVRWTLDTLSMLKWVSGNTEIYLGKQKPSRVEQHFSRLLNLIYQRSSTAEK